VRPSGKIALPGALRWSAPSPTFQRVHWKHLRSLANLVGGVCHVVHCLPGRGLDTRPFKAEPLATFKQNSVRRVPVRAVCGVGPAGGRHSAAAGCRELSQPEQLGRHGTPSENTPHWRTAGSDGFA